MTAETTTENPSGRPETVEELEFFRDETIQIIEEARTLNKEGKEISDGTFDYLLALNNTDFEANRTVLEQEAYIETLRSAGNALRDSSVAYVNELEGRLHTSLRDAEALADEVTELRAHLQDAAAK